MNSFIISFWSWIFEKLGYFSLYRTLQMKFPDVFAKAGTVEAWLLAHFAISIACLLLVTLCESNLMTFVVAAYSAARIYEAIVYQINFIFFDAYRNAKAGGIASPVRSYRRSVILVIQLYIEMIFWFSCLYYLFSEHFADANGTKVEKSAWTFWSTLYQSVETMTTFQPALAPADSYGRFLAIVHTTIALFLNIVLLSSVIALLPRRPSLSEHFQNSDDAI